MTVNVAGSGGAEEATLTVNLMGFESQQYAGFYYIAPSGEFVAQDPMSTQMTFPTTITTVKGGIVCFLTSGWMGSVGAYNVVGATVSKFYNNLVMCVNESQASFDIINLSD